MRNNRLGKNPSYGRINRAQANSQLQPSHLQDQLQPLKIKSGQNSGLGLYYKNQRPSHNVGSFQLRNSLGQRNNGIGASGASGRPALAGS